MSLARRHARLGWWTLLVFVSLGVVLESLHGFKVGWYLDIDNSTRRFMFRLAHAHGALMALMHIAFAATVPLLESSEGRRVRTASTLLTAGALLVPAGFFAGGFGIHGADPGYGVLLVPFGAVCLVVAIATIARSVAR